MEARTSYPRMFQESLNTAAYATTSGAATYLVRHAYQYPKGNRLKCGLEALNNRSPQLGKYSLLVAATLCTVDMAMEYARQKNDPINKITGLAAAACLLPIRPTGLGLGYRAAILCGAFFGKRLEPLL